MANIFYPLGVTRKITRAESLIDIIISFIIFDIILQVFEAVLRWVKKSSELRSEYLADIITNVRLPLMTPQYLADVVGSEELIKNSLPCR